MNGLMNLKGTVLALAYMVLSCLVGNAQKIMEVGEMQISLALQTYSAPVKNKSITGELLSVAGERLQKGIGVHSASKIKIKINDGQRFTAKVGVNDSKIDYSSEQITSIPLTDGKRMFYEISDTKKQFVGVEGNEGGV